MQVVKHDERLLSIALLSFFVFAFARRAPRRELYHRARRAADDLTAVVVVAPSWTPPRIGAPLRSTDVRRIIPILRAGPHLSSVPSFEIERGRRWRIAADPGPASKRTASSKLPPRVVTSHGARCRALHRRRRRPSALRRRASIEG